MEKKIRKMEKYDFVKNDEEIINIYEKVSKQEEKNKQRAYHNYIHVCNVANLTERLLTVLKCDDELIEEAKIAAILHDTGCTEGKEGHPQRSYEFAKNYLKRKKLDLKYEDRVLEAIKIHSNGFDTDNIIALSIILSDKLDIKYNRITEEGRSVIGNRQYQYVQDILIDISNDILQINFICDEKLNLIELEEYYFTDKVFKSIKSFCKIFNLRPRILINNKIWNEFYLRSNENAIIFDLDGTLWDVTDEAYRSINEIAKRHNIKEVSLDTVKGVFGLNKIDSAKHIFPDLEIEKSIELMKEMSQILISNLKENGGKLYDNLEQVLQELILDYKLFIVSNTSNSEYIEAFLYSLNSDKYFSDYIAASALNISKSEGIKKVIKDYNIKNAVYVGDTIIDKEAAENANVPFIYAKYGFGKLLETKYSINTIDELPNEIKKVFLEE